MPFRTILAFRHNRRARPEIRDNNGPTPGGFDLSMGDSSPTPRRNGGSSQHLCETRDTISDLEADRNDRVERIKRRSASSPTRSTRNYECPFWCATFSTILLNITCALWLFVALTQEPNEPSPFIPRSELNHIYADPESLEPQSKNRSLMSIGSPGANDFTQETQQEQPPQKTGVEQLDPECEGADWQSLSFPNCNSVHEIDLEAIQRRQAAGNENVGALSGGDGHYRAVWAVDPSSISREVLALKIMRGEREIHERNFDRHRRDALTMERLTSSPYIVDIYGFCGNTVLNEFIGETLMDVILDDQQGDDAASSPTRKTPEGRVRLALDVAKGVEAIHSIPGGPIVHADIQPGQFLMAADGTVKLNDFNRCRFMTRSTKTGNLCPFHIAQAGGETRSPEEYNIGELDAKMDIFSTANVLYSILSGEQAWTHWTSEEAQELVKAGLVLRVPDEFRTPDTLDGSLTNLTEQAYRFYPAERISAADLVKGLEGILSKSSMRDPSELGGRLVDQQTG